MLPMLVLALSLTVGEGAPPVKPVGSVDLGRYAGRWFEISRYPNRFQESCAGDVTATYERRDDGRIRVVNRCRRKDASVNEAEGLARVVEGSGNARLKLRFAPAWLGVLPFVWGDYWVIGLADDYRWAVVGTPDRKYLWVLARATSLSPEEESAALAKIRENHFEPSRLVPTTHRPAE